MAKPIRVAIVVPHIFMQREILPNVIFSPGELAIRLADGLMQLGAQIKLFTPGPIDSAVENINADMSLFETELSLRGDSYLDLLKKHPFTFITLARQVQSELVAKAYHMANTGEFDLVHIYINEEDTALPFAKLCQVPVVFTHHDPFNFLPKYRSVFSKYRSNNWISMSMAQRDDMPANTNWVANIYHGLPIDQYIFSPKANAEPYIVYFGRIIESKGVHLAIRAVNAYNSKNKAKMRLKIAGKHYSGHKDNYWEKHIKPFLKDNVEYVGYIRSTSAKQALLGGAKALIMPSTFKEPFGMVMIEALACGTPLMGLNSGSIPEIIQDQHTGYVIKWNKSSDYQAIKDMVTAFGKLDLINRAACRADFENRFTADRMCREHLQAYSKLVTR